MKIIAKYDSIFGSGFNVGDVFDATYNSDETTFIFTDKNSQVRYLCTELFYIVPSIYEEALGKIEETLNSAQESSEAIDAIDAIVKEVYHS